MQYLPAMVKVVLVYGYGIVLKCDQNLEKHYCEVQQHALPGALDTCANGQKCMLQISTQTDIMHDTISLAEER